MLLISNSEEEQTIQIDLNKSNSMIVCYPNLLAQNKLEAPLPTVPVSQSIKEYIIKAFSDLK